MTRKFSTAWLVVALAAEVVLAIVNADQGSGSVPTAAYLLPPLAVALVQKPRAVAVVGVVGVAS